MSAIRRQGVLNRLPVLSASTSEDARASDGIEERSVGMQTGSGVEALLLTRLKLRDIRCDRQGHPRPRLSWRLRAITGSTSCLDAIIMAEGFTV